MRQEAGLECQHSFCLQVKALELPRNSCRITTCNVQTGEAGVLLYKKCRD